MGGDRYCKGRTSGGPTNDRRVSLINYHCRFGFANFTPMRKKPSHSMIDQDMVPAPKDTARGHSRSTNLCLMCDAQEGEHDLAHCSFIRTGIGPPSA